MLRFRLHRTLPKAFRDIRIKDKVHFLEIAFGSLMEVMSQIEIATEMGYISVDDMGNIENQINKAAQLITSLQFSFMKKDENGNIVKPHSKEN